MFDKIELWSSQSRNICMFNRNLFKTVLQKQSETAAHRYPRSSSKQSVAFTPTPEGIPSLQSTRTVTVVVSEVVLDVVVAVKVSRARAKYQV